MTRDENIAIKSRMHDENIERTTHARFRSLSRRELACREGNSPGIMLFVTTAS
jgi:hypothetical protein